MTTYHCVTTLADDRVAARRDPDIVAACHAFTGALLAGHTPCYVRRSGGADGRLVAHSAWTPAANIGS